MYLIETKKLLDLKFPNFRFEPNAQGMFMLSIMLGQAKYYSDNLSENIRRGIRAKIRKGVYFSKAPLGYYNDARTRTVEPHPELFSKVKTFFELFATGEYNMTEGRQLATELEIFGQRRNKPLTLSTVERLILNPFYYGVFTHKGEFHQGVHAPMLSKETWDAAQVALNQCKRLGKRSDKGFAFLQFARCGTCGYWITAERHIKKSGLVLNYYRCTKKSHHCTESKYLPEKEMMKQVRAVVELVALPNTQAQSFLERVEEWKTEARSSAASTTKRLIEELERVKSKITKLEDGFLDGLFEKAEFRRRKNTLIDQKIELEQKLEMTEEGNNRWLEPLKAWVLAAKSAQNLANVGTPGELSFFLKKTGSNRLIRGGKLVVDFKKPWNLLAETVMNLREQDSSSDTTSVWWRRRELKAVEDFAMLRGGA